MAAYITSIIAIVTLFFQIINPSAGYIFGGTNKNFDSWSSADAYTRDYAAELEKQPGEDFVILNLTDVQLAVGETEGDAGKLARATIDALVEKNQPDLITLTGDNAWALDSYQDLVKTIESYGIPWAPVMGNHDGQWCLNEGWCADQFAKAPNCLFKYGPKDMGYGNYVINITENGRIIHTLYMMDSHSNVEKDGINGTKKDGGYDHFWESQFDWYEWNVNGIKKIAGRNVQSTVFMHIPLVEYRTAWEEAYDMENGEYKGLYKLTSFGENHEGICSANENNGFFAFAKELGSTKDFVCGHDHVNCASIVYQGIRLTYGVKTGSGCYWEPEMSGGTIITINSLGMTDIHHDYVDPYEYDVDVSKLG